VTECDIIACIYNVSRVIKSVSGYRVYYCRHDSVICLIFAVVIGTKLLVTDWLSATRVGIWCCFCGLLSLSVVDMFYIFSHKEMVLPLMEIITFELTAINIPVLFISEMCTSW